MHTPVNIKVTRPEAFVTLKEDKRPGGWCEIGVYVDPVIKGGSLILVAVITHPCTGGKWFVSGLGWNKHRTNTRKAALEHAFDMVRHSAAYKILTRREGEEVT